MRRAKSTNPRMAMTIAKLISPTLLLVSKFCPRELQKQNIQITFSTHSTRITNQQSFKRKYLKFLNPHQKQYKYLVMKGEEVEAKESEKIPKWKKLVAVGLHKSEILLALR